MKNWNQCLIVSSAKILEAIQVIDREALQIALVVNEQEALIGTVTDGDIRRGILRGLSVEASVREVMNPDPIVVNMEIPQEEALDLMKRRSIRQLPVVDESRRIVKVYHIDQVLNSGEKNQSVVIMAGGMGSRLMPLTETCPKAMLKVGGAPILETIISQFRSRGFRRIYLSVNYMADVIEKHFGDGQDFGVEIQYLRENKRLGTAGPLSLLPPQQDSIFVMNCDLLTNVNFDQVLHFHQAEKAAATMCVREYSFQVPYGVVTVDRNLIKAIDEKPTHGFFVNAGIYMFSPQVLKLIPEGEYFDMNDLFARLMELHQPVAAYPIREYWLDIGRMDDLAQAGQDFADVFGAASRMNN